MTEKTEGIKIEDQPLQEEQETPEAEAAEEAKAEQTEAEEAEDAKAGEAEDAKAGEAEADKAEADDARYLRLLAEFQNYKKRTEKEKTDLYSYANEKIMTELLEVLDNFERALQAEPGDGFKEGMELIFTQLTNVLTKAGLAEITALGEDFDPNVHNAVMAEETEEYESGKVSGVMQKGYTL
ncbi:MAG: nucleotide exchange factor GrpE, partial [Firmicutes bacterium]|nr:nucleotide exchange factor GrpE [Bacillota bacterium]